MSSVVFVHGTGVRGEAYERSFELVRGEIVAEKPLVDVRKCAWGDIEGVKLNAGGASIPTYDTARAVGEAGEPESIALWSELYDDPVYELRLLAASKPEEEDEEAAPNQAVPWAKLSKTVGALAEPPDEIRETLKTLGYEGLWREAHELVTRSDEYDAALRSVGSARNELHAAIGRALIAALLMLAQDADLPIPNAAVRDRLVDQVIAKLGTQDRSVAGRLAAPLKWAGVRLGTRYAKRKRGVISDSSFPLVGDIILYQARGKGIRKRIREAICDAPEPVTVIAHSLGGIATVDLLAMTPIAKVKRLVTVGSQSSLFYEMDCLISRRWNKPLPMDFPEWLNIYDLRDMLSYVCEGVFRTNVHDKKVDNGQPFPQSHSAYWTNPAVWKLIVPFIA